MENKLLKHKELEELLKTVVRVFKTFDLRIKSLEAAMVDFKNTLEDFEDEIRRNKE